METTEARNPTDSPGMGRRDGGFDLLVFLAMGLLVSGLAYVCAQCHASRLEERLLNPVGPRVELRLDEETIR